MNGVGGVDRKTYCGDVDSPKSTNPPGDSEKERIWVVDGESRRPFMRGILVHSLTARGLGFEDALESTNRVQGQLQSLGQVTRVHLAEIVQSVVGTKLASVEATRESWLPTIVVEEDSGTSPFSKGRLSQALLAAAIDPNDAFDVAHKIELDLRRERVHSIKRADLRRRSYEVLLERFDLRTAERYLVWRKYQEPEKPVLILIGGTTGAGKTSVALEVALRLGIGRVLSSDSIRQIMRMMLAPDLMPSIHGSSFDAHQRLPAASTGANPVVEGFVAQSSVVGVGVRAMLDRAIEENTSLVLDGVALVPGLLDLDAYTDVAHVIFMVMVRLDEESFRQHFANRAKNENRGDGSRYVESLDEILQIQEHFLELADRFDVPIIDNVSIEESVLHVIRYVVETLREKEALDVSGRL
jgi:2-phosphoglycerate kinase